MSEAAELAEIQNLDDFKLDKDEVSESFDDLFGSSGLSSPLSFGDFDDELAYLDRQRAGRKHDYPHMEGAWVHIAHMSTAKDAIEGLQAKYRKERKWTAKELPPGVLDKLLWLSGFGTFVKGWGGFLSKGKEIPYGTAGYQRLLKSRLFRDFVSLKATEEDEAEVSSNESTKKA